MTAREDTNDGSPLVSRLLDALGAAVEGAVVLDALDRARRRGATREQLYEALAEAVEQRRERAPTLSDGDEEALGDLLDRLWGFCRASRVLFPDLPPLSESSLDGMD